MFLSRRSFLHFLLGNNAQPRRLYKTRKAIFLSRHRIFQDCMRLHHPCQCKSDLSCTVCKNRVWLGSFDLRRFQEGREGGMPHCSNSPWRSRCTRSTSLAGTECCTFHLDTGVGWLHHCSNALVHTQRRSLHLSDRTQDCTVCKRSPCPDSFDLRTSPKDRVVAPPHCSNSPWRSRCTRSTLLAG
jgi:hypothetical protein